jgi:decaprenyl-phosphate phosphoribosyltransferase
MKKFYQLLRVNHYIKNFLVFIPLLFTTGINNIDDLFESFYAFIIFCLIASSVYIFNDIFDLKSDKKHPKKRRYKPIASGIVSLKQSKFILLLLILSSVILINFNKKFLIISLIYLVVNFFYTIYLKKIPFLDIFILSSNYIIRIYMGCVALSVGLSGWMAITVFFGALFISALKRKQELLLYGSVSRKVLKNYSLKGLKKIIDISAILSVLFYGLYVISINDKLFLTIPLVVYGVLRYNHLSESKKFTDSPVDEIIKDKQNILIIIIWLLMVINSNI